MLSATRRLKLVIPSSSHTCHSPTISPASRTTTILCATENTDFNALDPFADAQDVDTGDTSGDTNATNIHIRIQQRNGRKTLTTVEGIPSKFDLKKILTVIKKQFACNGTVVKDEKAGDVIQLQGDQRNKVAVFLSDKKGLRIDAKTIKVHGF
ncbi:SUI1-domain-containing protein [Microthyrium microscopicum]|uniref:SUI1-domain-containing protein n=1 Tax=Microthyrium microscopicum TaxID=703497 RepID=A0A6A6UU48_9PEZI|nr:SUI1-domain-containing protein [Microthyrium microscopicum]